MSSTLYISLEGMRSAQGRLERAADNIARGGTQLSAPKVQAGEDTGSLAKEQISVPDYTVELLNVLRARTDYKANLKTAVTVQELEKETLDLLA